MLNPRLAFIALGFQQHVAHCGLRCRVGGGFFVVGSAGCDKGASRAKVKLRMAPRLWTLGYLKAAMLAGHCVAEPPWWGCQAPCIVRTLLAMYRLRLRARPILVRVNATMCRARHCGPWGVGHDHGSVSLRYAFMCAQVGMVSVRMSPDTPP